MGFDAMVDTAQQSVGHAPFAGFFDTAYNHRCGTVRDGCAVRLAQGGDNGIRRQQFSQRELPAHLRMGITYGISAGPYHDFRHGPLCGQAPVQQQPRLHRGQRDAVQPQWRKVIGIQLLGQDNGQFAG